MFYCLSLPTVVDDINVETLKENGILLSLFAKHLVEAWFLKKCNRLRLFTRKVVSNKVSKILYLFDSHPINNIHRPKNSILI